MGRRGIKLGIEFGERYGDWRCRYCHLWIDDNKYVLPDGSQGPIYHKECYMKQEKIEKEIGKKEDEIKNALENTDGELFFKLIEEQEELKNFLKKKYKRWLELPI